MRSRTIFGLTILALVLTIGCNGGLLGPGTFSISSFNPATAPPGKLVKANCSGVSAAITAELTLSFGDLELPVVGHGDGYISFYIPPLDAGAYQVILYKGGLTTPPVNFTISPIANLPYTQAEFAVVVNEGFKGLEEIGESLIQDIDDQLDLYSDDEMAEFGELFDDLDAICGQIGEEIGQLPVADAEMLQCVFRESGILEILSGLRSVASRIGDAERHGDAIHPIHQILFEADTLSATITNIGPIIDLINVGSIALTIATGGAAAPAIPLTIGTKVVLILTDWALDTFIPTDLWDIEIKQVSSSMVIHDVQKPVFIGHFKCQENALGNTMDAMFRLAWAALSTPDAIGNVIKDQVKLALFNILGKIGINAATQYMTDHLAEHFGDSPIFTDIQTELDMDLYNLDIYDVYDMTLPGVSLQPLFNIFEACGYEFVLIDSVEYDHSILEYRYFPEELEAKALGQSNVKAIGSVKEPTTLLWIFTFELDKPIESDSVIVTVSESAAPYPVWDDTIGIKATELVESQVQITFGTATDPQGDNPVTYNLYIVDETATASQDPFGTSGSVEKKITSPYLKGGLTENHKYWFGIRAEDSKGNEDPNVERLSVTIPPLSNECPVWDSTIGIVDVAPFEGYANVKYGSATDPQGDVVQYNVYYVDSINSTDPFNGTGHVKLSNVGPPEYYTVNGLETDHTYYFGVRTSDDNGHEDGNTNKLLAFIPPPSNGCPVWDTTVGIVDVAPFEGYANVKYGSATDPEGDSVQYNVYYVDSINSIDPFNGTGHVKLSNVGPPEYHTVNDLELDHTYYFGVRTSDDKGHEDTNTNKLSAKIPDPGWEPSIVKTVPTPGIAYGVAVSGGYAYVADGNPGLQIIDIEPLSSAYIVNAVVTHYARNVVVSGGYAYVADDEAGLQIVDVEPLSSANIVKTVYMPPGRAFDVAVSGGYAYVADDEAGLQIVDVEPPLSANIVKTVDTPGCAYGVAVSGGYAYVADVGSLHIIDVEPLLSASIVKSVYTPGEAWGVAVSGGHAYVADVGSLQIIDVEPPSSAYIVEAVALHYAYGVAVSGGYAYVGDWDAALQIIDVEPPSSANIVKTVDTPDYAEGVAVSGDYAYVTCWYSGLLIIDISGYN